MKRNVPWFESGEVMRNKKNAPSFHGHDNGIERKPHVPQGKPGKIRIVYPQIEYITALVHAHKQGCAGRRSDEMVEKIDDCRGRIHDQDTQGVEAPEVVSVIQAGHQSLCAEMIVRGFTDFEIVIIRKHGHNRAGTMAADPFQAGCRQLRNPEDLDSLGFFRTGVGPGCGEFHREIPGRPGQGKCGRPAVGAENHGIPDTFKPRGSAASDRPGFLLITSSPRPRPD